MYLSANISRLFLVLSILVLSACSTYKTNTSLTFDSDKTSLQPAVLIGKQDLEAHRLDYLGWVEAKVTKPSPFHKRPSKHQGDVVLGLLAKEKSAQAVFFVTYDWDIMGNLRAKGQAVRVEGVSQLANYQAKLEQKQAQEKVQRIEQLKDENRDNPSVLLDVEGDALAEAYMRANPIEQQIENAKPIMTEIPRAEVATMQELLEELQRQAFHDKDIQAYATLTEILHKLSLYQASSYDAR